MTRARCNRIEKRGVQKKTKMKEEARAESPFFGFSNCDIPQPIVIKTEPVEEGDTMDCVVVKVTKAAKPLPATLIKKEKEDDDDIDTFHGFSLADLPKPIVINIKEELINEEGSTATETEVPDKITELQGEKTTKNVQKVSENMSEIGKRLEESKKWNETNKKEDSPNVEKLPETSPSQSEIERKLENDPISKPEVVAQTTLPDVKYNIADVSPAPASNIPGDNLLDEFESPGVELDRENNAPPEVSKVNSGSPIKMKKIANSSNKFSPSTPVKSVRIGSADVKSPAVTPTQSTIKSAANHELIVVQQQDGKQVIMQQPRFVTRPSVKNHQRQEQSTDIQVVRGEGKLVHRASSLPKKIQIIDENGEKIELITQEAEGDFDTGDETDEDHEFTVVVEENDKGEVTNITGDISHTNVIEADSIEDIIAQFEHETSNGPQSKTKEQEAKDIENDLIRRKRNIDLIAKETALLGRKPIEPEKYYNQPLEDEEDEDDDGDLGDDETYSPSPTKLQKTEVKQNIIDEDSSEEVKLACGMAGCDMVFDNRGALKRHRTEAHPELEEFKPVDLEPDDPDRAAEMTVACPVCERKFKHKNTCTVHIKTNHLGWSKRKLFECPECQRPFDNKKAVEAHREAVHLGIRTVCPLCEKPVTRLDLHVRMVHTDLPEWPCPDCGKKFKRKFDLNRHRVTVHLGVRNFPCDLCGKRFADMKDMNRHKNAVHYGMKIKWNSRKYKEKKGQVKPKKPKTEATSELNYNRKRNNQQLKLEESNVTYIETVETSGEEIIAMEGLEGSTVILENGTVLQSHLEAVKGAPGEPQVFIEADPDGQGAYRFVVMTEEDAGTVLEAADIVEVR